MVRCDDGVMVRCDRRPAAGGCERREAVVVAAVAVVVAVVAVVVAVVAVVFFPSPQMMATLFITFTCCMYVTSISRTRAANFLTIGRTCLNGVQASAKHALATQALFFLPYPTWFKLILYDLLGFQTPNSPDNPLFSSYSDLLCISPKPYRSQVIEEPGEWRR